MPALRWVPVALFLSDEWVALQRKLTAELPERPGATARLQHVIGGGPDGEVRYHHVLDDGRLVDAGTGDDPDAEITLTWTYGDVTDVLRGDAELNALFMQGRLKTAGDTGKLLSLLPVFDSPEYRAAQEALAERTDWSAT